MGWAGLANYRTTKITNHLLKYLFVFRWRQLLPRRVSSFRDSAALQNCQIYILQFKENGNPNSSSPQSLLLRDFAALQDCQIYILQFQVSGNRNSSLLPQQVKPRWTMFIISRTLSPQSLLLSDSAALQNRQIYLLQFQVFVIWALPYFTRI